MQAITTKYHGPTNTKPGRVSATAEAGRVIFSWNHALNTDDNHAAAARALRDKFGWKGRMVGGHLPQSNSAHMCFVFDDALSVSVGA